MTADRLTSGVIASNALTARWAGAARGRGGPFVISGAAVWPLLAALAAGAEGPAREELERAVGVPATEAQRGAADVIDVIARAAGVHVAIGLWVSEKIRLHARWASALPAGTRGVLGGSAERDQAMLDGWVRERTLGIIDRLPGRMDDETVLLLAACLAIRTTWERRFEGGFLGRPFSSGPWKDRLTAILHASFADLDRVAVVDTPIGPVTTFDSRGTDAVDVHLVLGPESAAPADVLREGIAAATSLGPRRTGADLNPGDTAPGLLVKTVPSNRPDSWPGSHFISVKMVPFEVKAEHDLLRRGDLFGLTAASDARRGHFPGIGDSPLAIRRAVQGARAMFTATGFEAGAVTSVSMMDALALGPPSRYTVRVIRLVFDRPFGFVAMDRQSGLVLLAGWVEEPAPHPDPADDEGLGEEGLQPRLARRR